MISTSTSAPLIVVVGATGAQGGSAIKALQASPKEYRIRGITRDTSKPSSTALENEGVEMVSTNLHADNVEEVTKVFSGATVVFVVTNFWEHMDMDREVAEGKMTVDAAKKAAVKLFIWSGLVHCGEISNGKYTHVTHFDGKADVTKYIAESGVNYVNVMPSMYMQNFLTMAAPKKQEDGSYAIFGVGDAESYTPLIDIKEDYGLFVVKAIEEEVPSGTEIYAYGENITWGQMAKELGEILGKDVKYIQVTKEQYLNGPWPNQALALEMYDMYAFIGECGYYGHQDIAASHQGLSRKALTFKEFAQKQDWSKVVN